MNINMKTVKLKLLHRVLLVNAYNCAKFQLPSSISYGDMEGSQNKKIGAVDLPRCPLADKLLHVAIVPANGYQRTKFRLSSSISFRDMRRFQNKNYELLNQTPLADKFCTWR